MSSFTLAYLEKKRREELERKKAIDAKEKERRKKQEKLRILNLEHKKQRNIRYNSRKPDMLS